MINQNSGYGQSVFSGGLFSPRSPNGRQFIVGSDTVELRNQAKELYKPDTRGIFRYFSTLAAALAAIVNDIGDTAIACTVSGNVFTSTGAHGLNLGDKVQLQGTVAPTGLTLGVVYYVIAGSLTATTFTLSLQRNGTVITLSGAGTAVSVIADDSVGDVIYVLPGHTENISTATALNINTSGVSIVGLGEGEARPTFYLDTATTSVITISAANILLQNIIIDGTGFAAIATMVKVTAPNVHIDSCTFISGNSTNQAGLVVTTNALCDKFRFTNNKVVGTTDAGTTNALQIVGGNDLEIVGNFFYGAYTTSLGPINNATTASLRIRIENNTLINATASSTKAIVLVSTTTGMVRSNAIAILSGTAPITGAGVFVSSNYYVAAVGVTASTLL